MLRTVFDALASGFAQFFKNANRVNVGLLERCNPIFEFSVAGQRARFYCPNRLSLWRVKTLFTKEPDTIRWIESFRHEDVFCDIGANIGLYSVYAALRGNRVLAFEPEAQNYAVLNRNIHANNLDHLIDAYNIALSCETRVSHLYLPEVIPGGALNNLDEPLDHNRESFKPAFRQSVLAFTLDEFLEKLGHPTPHHIKIDVDGIESAVVAGLRHTLADRNIRSVLVELNRSLPADLEIIQLLKAQGFIVESEYHSPLFDEGRFKDVFNYIFRRTT